MLFQVFLVNTERRRAVPERHLGAGSGHAHLDARTVFVRKGRRAAAAAVLGARQPAADDAAGDAANGGACARALAGQPAQHRRSHQGAQWLGLCPVPSHCTCSENIVWLRSRVLLLDACISC